MKAFLVIASLILVGFLYFTETQIHSLREENSKLNKEKLGLEKKIDICHQEWHIQLEHIQKYETAFETLQKSKPEIAEAFDLLINGIDPWQNKKSNQQSSSSEEKTTHASKRGNGTLQETNTVPYR
jgi:hypothetical protein